MAAGAVSRPEESSIAVTAATAVEACALRLETARIPALDGLRGMAILLVLAWHGIFQVQLESKTISRLLSIGSLSWSGVDLFFVLSGFLIGGILLDAKDSPRYFSTFYIRRAYRILPLYALLAGAMVLTRSPFLPAWIRQSSPDPVPLWSYVTFTQNIWMAVTASFGSVIMSATWSLAIEEQFYLTSPILIRNLTYPVLARGLIATVLLVPLLRTVLCFYLPHGGFASYVLMPCRADDLCMGVLVAMLTRDRALWARVRAQRRMLFWIAGTLAIPLAYFSWRQYGPYSRPMVTIGYSLLGIFYTCWLIVALTASGPVRRLLCQKRLMQLGTIAYCAYLLHLPMIEFWVRLLRQRFSGGAAVDFAAGLLGIGLTLGIAAWSWKVFERPLLRKGHAYKYQD